MFAKETYMQRRALLKKNLGSGVLLFLGNDECGLNYEDNTFRYRQDSTFLYYFGLSCAGLSAIIDIDEDKEIIFGDELSIDAIVWMGSQPTLHEKCERGTPPDRECHFRRGAPLHPHSTTVCGIWWRHTGFPMHALSPSPQYVYAPRISI